MTKPTPRPKFRVGQVVMAKESEMMPPLPIQVVRMSTDGSRAWDTFDYEWRLDQVRSLTARERGPEPRKRGKP